jgi:hypothetical protein
MPTFYGDFGSHEKSELPLDPGKYFVGNGHREIIFNVSNGDVWIPWIQLSTDTITS